MPDASNCLSIETSVPFGLPCQAIFGIWSPKIKQFSLSVDLGVRGETMLRKDKENSTDSTLQCKKEPQRLYWRSIHIPLVICCLLTLTSMGIASTENCQPSQADYNSLYDNYKAEALRWQSETGTKHAVPHHGSAGNCDQLQKNYESLRNEFNQFSDKYLERLDKIRDIDQARENEENKTNQSRRNQAKKNFTDQINRVDEFLKIDTQNVQSTDNKLKTALEHLTALRDLVKSDEFPPPWDVSHDQLILKPHDQPIGGNCKCR